MKKRSIIVTALLLLAGFAFAASTIDSGAIMPETTARGRALYEYDQAAWHATDAVQATNPPQQALGRYIAYKSDGRWTVAFGHLNARGDKFLITYEALQGATAQEFTPRKLDPPREDTSFYLWAAKAMDLALQDFHGEQRQYNIAVLPAASDLLYVYIVPAQTKDGIYPLGGDVRYLVTANGSSILEKRQLHKTILEVSPGSVPKDAAATAGYHTHVLTDVPEDTDVFYVLTREPSQPEFIRTKDKTYEISIDGTIHERKM